MDTVTCFWSGKTLSVLFQTDCLYSISYSFMEFIQASTHTTRAGSTRITCEHMEESEPAEIQRRNKHWRGEIRRCQMPLLLGFYLLSCFQFGLTIFLSKCARPLWKNCQDTSMHSVLQKPDHGKANTGCSTSFEHILGVTANESIQPLFMI